MAQNPLDAIAPVIRDGVDEDEFRKWYAERAKKWGLSPDPDDPKHFYDYRAAFENGAEPDPKDGHWPSEYKLEGHPNLIVDGKDTRTGEPVSNPLDDIAPNLGAKAATGNPLDDIAPVIADPLKRQTERGYAARGVSMLMSPIPALRDMSRKISDVVDITPRSNTEDTGRFEVPENAAGWGDLATGMVENIVTAPKKAAELWMDIVKLIHDKDPAVGQATRRGLAAGMIDLVGDTTPLDLLTAKTGSTLVKKTLARGRAGRAAKAGAVSSPSSAAATPAVGPPKVPVAPEKPLRTVAPASAPESWEGARLVRERPTTPDTTLEGRLAQEIADILEQERRAKLEPPDENWLPPAEPPPRRPLMGRNRDIYQPGVDMPALPEQGGNLSGGNYIRPDGTEVPLSRVNPDEEVARAIRALQRAAEIAERGTEMPRVPPSPRGTRPTAKLSEIGPDSTLAELTDAVNDLSRREPEVIAPRNLDLETQAVEMSRQPLAPNPEANAALVGERVPNVAMQQNRSPPAWPHSPIAVDRAASSCG